MLLRSLQLCCLCTTAVALASCATVIDPSADFAAARSMIQDTTGTEFPFDPALAALSVTEIELVLAGGFTLDEALSLALANNRHLHAGFLELGVGHADFVQAGLLKNPSLSLAFLLPSGGGRTRAGVDLVASVAELWQLRQREDVARLSQNQRILDLSRFAAELIVDTKSAYFKIVAVREARAVAEQGMVLARLVLAGVQRQVAIGVATRTDEELARAAVLNAELAYRRHSQGEEADKQRLASLLSLNIDMREVRLTDSLPDADALAELDSALVARGQQLRLDVRSATLALETANARVQLERNRTIPAAAVGITSERPEGGSSAGFLGGITGSVELPLFDQNQAQVSRAEYRRDALAKELEALAAEVAAQVRAALDRANAARSTALFLERDVLPQAEASAALAQRAYELGDTTVLSLLETQQRVLQTRQDLVDARLEIARTQLELERSVGMPLSVLRRTASSQ